MNKDTYASKTRIATGANHFVLNGSGCDVIYTIGGVPGGIQREIHYKGGAFARIFADSQIQSDDTGLGNSYRYP